MYRVGPMLHIIKRSTSLGLTLPPPPCDVSKEACPSYHIKGLCNT